MVKSLIGKFSLLYWLLFLALIIPIYIFTTQHFNTILENAEKEKVTLTFDTLKPLIALNLSFDQAEMINETLESFYKHKDIRTIKLTSSDGTILFEKSKAHALSRQTYLFQSSINDPFSDKPIAVASIIYTNEHLEHLAINTFIILISVLLFSILFFLLGYAYLHDDLKGLRMLSEWLKQYMRSKEIQTIDIPGKSREVRTIAAAANEMVNNLSEYVRQLESFNKELEIRVEKAVEEQRKQEQLMTHQARLAAMGEMIESIAHQWRQPLNNIGLAVASIETKFLFGTLDQEKFDSKVKLISANLNYMSDTIDDFRNFLDPNRMEVDFSPEKTIEDVFTILSAQLRHDNISHVVETECHFKIHGVENELKQVLLVLINNARDAIKEQIAKKLIDQGFITITVSRQDDHGVITVNDNGGGIDDAIKHSIFEPYFTTKFKNQGTGIGLYMAKNIIENKMGGSLKVTDIESGSCFTIRLPIKEERE